MNSIKFCNSKDIILLMHFLKKNWSRNHVLAKNKKLLRWQHQSHCKNSYNFVIEEINSKIVGCLGFIKHSRYSSNLKNKDTLWIALWLSDKSKSLSSLSLLSFLFKNEKFENIGVIGINSKTNFICKSLGFNLGQLDHYFTINPNIKSFKLIKIPNSLRKQLVLPINKNEKKIELIINKKFDFKIFGKNKKILKQKFRKDRLFYIKRYLSHPFYKYKIYWIKKSKKIMGFIVTRICEHKNSKALRIVDFFGYEEALINIGSAVQKILIKKNIEYADFYVHGINKKIMMKSSLLMNQFKKNIVIPNYFEPFIHKNINIKFAYRSNYNKVAPIYKGDGDQDRPNQL